MSEEFIIQGIKYALVKGQSKEQAAQSFINAGYSAQEVNSAMRSFNETPIQNTSPVSRPQELKKITPKISDYGTKQNLKPKGFFKGWIFVMILVIILASLIGVLGYLVLGV